MTSCSLLTLQVNNFWNENSTVWIGKLGCLFHIAGQNVSSDWLLHFPFDLIFLFALLCTPNVCIPLQSNLFLCAGMLIIPKRRTWLGVHVVNVRFVPLFTLRAPKVLKPGHEYDLLMCTITFIYLTCIFLSTFYSSLLFLVFFFLGCRCMISWKMILTVEAV